MLTSQDDQDTGGQSAHRGHVLLVSPNTFSYHLSIAETLRSMGYAVTWWDDRAKSSTWYKLAIRLFPSITARWSDHAYLERLRQLNPTSISHVLVVKGEGLSRQVVSEMRKTLTSASFGLYLWDGVANVKGVSNILQAFDSVATFDPVDAKTFGWTFRPLFGRHISAVKKTPEPVTFDWCFIGTVHSDRHLVIHRLRQRYGQQVQSFVFAYFPSPLMLFVRRLTDWTLWFAPKGTLSTQAMSAAEVAQVVKCSKAVLDVEHPGQCGLTMRTIETLLAEKKLMTTNQYISESTLFDPSRVVVINRNKPEIPVNFLDTYFEPIAQSLRNYYSCAGWVSELLALQDKARNSKVNSGPRDQQVVNEKII